MRLLRSRFPVWILVISLTICTQAQLGPSKSSSKIVEKNLTFPSPVQWQTNSAEISLIHVAWGPADSVEMLSKGRQSLVQERPEFYPDRSYVLALGFRAKSMSAIPTKTVSTSGLIRVKNVDGDTEPPVVLTPAGFVFFAGSPGVYDVRFDNNTTTEYWDFFPTAPEQREFLFQVFPGIVRANVPKLSFKIVLQDGGLAIIDASPQLGTACLNFRGDYTGTVGSTVRVNLHLAREIDTLSGTEQYERVGETLWVKGSADSLGNFVLEERYPEERITGTFKGKFSSGCQVMQGYFAKPDGSRLQPFEFRQVHSDTQQMAPSQDCGADEVTQKPNSNQ